MFEFIFESGEKKSLFHGEKNKDPAKPLILFLRQKFFISSLPAGLIDEEERML